MAKISEKAKTRKEMLDFIVSNLVAKEINQSERFIELIDYRENPFLIIPYSSRLNEFVKDTGFDKVTDDTILDRDRANLFGISVYLLNYISEINRGISLPEDGLLMDYVNTMKGLNIVSNPITPVFMLQQSNTDFSQTSYDKRYDKIVNRGGNFNKQELGTKINPKPSLSTRKLGELELVLWMLGQKTNRNFNKTEQKYIEHGFLPATYVFNPNIGSIQENWYKHQKARIKIGGISKLVDYKYFQNDLPCPVCQNYSGEVDHSGCRDPNNEGYNKYRQYVKSRNQARYSKTLKIMKNIHEREIGSRDKNKGIRLDSLRLPVNYVKTLLPYTRKDLYVGALR